MANCSKCGQKNPEDAEYCNKCGSKINNSKHESQLEKNIDDFGEEMEHIGKKIGDTFEQTFKNLESKHEKKENVQTNEDIDYKRLYRSGKDKMLGGICGGLAEYFKIDPLLTRIAFIVGLFITFGVMIIAYLLMWVIVPRNPKHKWNMK